MADPGPTHLVDPRASDKHLPADRHQRLKPVAKRLGKKLDQALEDLERLELEAPVSGLMQ